MRTTSKRVTALLLALVLLLALGACAQTQQTETDEPTASTGGSGGKYALPTRNDSEPPEKQPEPTPEPPEQTVFSEAAQNSLMWLRDRIDFPQTMFGAAYLDYVGGLFEEGFEAGFPEWMWEENEAMLLEYPFIAEIDAEHIVGGAGHLYCIVPVDENASVSINRMEWNKNTCAFEVSNVLYRSETGEPVLLFANLDGIAYESDTQVLITDSSGNTCEWWPSLDAMGCLAPCLSEDGDYLAFDFTEYGWMNAPLDLAPWFAEGWSGMTALGLAGSEDWGMGWFVETTAWDTDLPAYFSLRFYQEDETGGMVELDWFYNDSDYADESWFGYWTIETVLDGPSYVTLDISLVGGQNYDETADPIYLEETYPMLISPSGTELLIAKGETGICLPFMSRSTTACTLTLIEG